MKKYIFILVFILSACSVGTTNDPKEEQGEFSINETIADQNIELGADTLKFNLLPIFYFKNQVDSSIIYSISENTNTNLLSTKFKGKELQIILNKGKTGSSDLILKGQIGSNSITTSFTVTVEQNQNKIMLDNAFGYYQTEKYSDAISLFDDLIETNDKRYIEQARLGRAYSQLKLELIEEAFISFTENISTAIHYKNENKAGLCFMNYALENIETSREQGLQVNLSTNGTFILFFDKEINNKDILLHIALSNFYLGLFKAAHEIILKLNPKFILSKSEPDYHYLLDEELRRLVAELR
jgi:hypothetical protein